MSLCNPKYRSFLKINFFFWVNLSVMTSPSLTLIVFHCYYSGLCLHIFPTGLDKLDSIGDVHSCRVPEDEEESISVESLQSDDPKVLVFSNISCYKP